MNENVIDVLIYIYENYMGNEDNIPHDQIMLELTRADTSSNAVTASYAYIDNGVAGSTQSLTGSADIFNGEDWTRAQFVARTVVPVPAAVWLFGSGLIALIGLARRTKS